MESTITPRFTTNDSGIWENESASTGFPELSEEPLSSATVSVTLAMYIILIITGSVGTGATVYTVYCNKKLHGLVYILAAVASLSDLLMIPLDYPLRVATIVNGNWTFGEHWCHVQVYANYCFITTSGLCILFTGLVRYIQVVRPTLFNRLSDKLGTRWLAVVPFLLSIVPLIPSFVSDRQRVQYAPQFMSCRLNSEDFLVVSKIQLVLVHIPCPLFTPVFYFLIYWTVRKSYIRISSNNSLAPVPNGHTSRVLERIKKEKRKKKHQVTKTGFVIFIVFILTYVLPGVIKIIGKYTDAVRVCNITSAIIIRAAPTANTAVYFSVNTTMRQAYLAMMKMCDFRSSRCCRRQIVQRQQELFANRNPAPKPPKIYVIGPDGTAETGNAKKKPRSFAGVITFRPGGSVAQIKPCT